jgi:hypothetical protein
MEIKKQYEINDDVWIHIGTGKLHKGKIVEYFDLGHIGRDRSTEYYVIEIPTSIEPLLEVRTWQEMSQDQKGPLACYRNMEDSAETFKKMGKLGIQMPVVDNSLSELLDDLEPDDPTPEQVNAALERAVKSRQEVFTTATLKQPKKRTYRKKNERRAGPTTL